jgi:malate dehydrogenase (oxaloacetate-decarboxylating)(NADP+)
VNNALCFPYLFRGALDVRATTINDEMMLAAVYAIQALAKEPVPNEVLAAYGIEHSLEFGPAYLLPKPVDSRLKDRVSSAVAKAAIASGVAGEAFLVSEAEEVM